MDLTTVVFLVITAFSLAIYAGLAYANLWLAGVMKHGNGLSVTILKLLAVLSIVVFLNDLFWVLALLIPQAFPLVAGSMSYHIVAVAVNAVMRFVPAVVLFRLWHQVFLSSADLESVDEL